MSSDYETLLGAAVDYLQELKTQGMQYVPVGSETLAELSKPAPKVFFPKQPEQTVASQENIKSPHPAFSHPLPVSETGRGQGEGRSSLSQAGLSENESTFAGEPLSREGKEAAMADLRCRALACQKCPSLASSRKNVVFGVGTVHTDLMFVGEAPGADEDQQGEPFVGKAGQLLTKIIQTMGFSRETVYIANILKCRPDTPGQLSGNRKPTADEMKTCMPYLLEQIEIIRPKVIVALGGTAVEGLFGGPVGIMKLRGNWRMFRNIPVMLTYHPAYLLRNMAMSEKRKVWEDMLKVLEKLGQPISEKQRSYFLRG